jgi:hypothetical protein
MASWHALNNNYFSKHCIVLYIYEAFGNLYIAVIRKSKITHIYIYI